MIIIKSSNQIYIGYSIHEFGYSHLTKNTLRLYGNQFLFKSNIDPTVTIICNEVGLLRDIYRFEIKYPQELSVYSIQTAVIPQLNSCAADMEEFKDSKEKTFKENCILIKNNRIFLITTKGYVEEIFDSCFVGDYQKSANVILDIHKHAHPENRIIYVYDYLESVYNTKFSEIIFEKI